MGVNYDVVFVYFNQKVSGPWTLVKIIKNT